MLDVWYVGFEFAKQIRLTPTSNFPHLTSQMVGLSGLEPLTSRLSGVRSNQLSYRPIKELLYYHSVLYISTSTFW